jgi:hypothetical protein
VAGALDGEASVLGLADDLNPVVAREHRAFPSSASSHSSGADFTSVSIVAFYASARGLQIGPGVEVIAITSVAANLTAIVGGILIFRDPVGTGALEITGRMLAFLLVIAGAALIPAPVRATDGGRGGGASQV